ncbi:uncharacterized protein LOC123293315 isoform X2 [Chrysoperla carnea]|uniref:uncharacterized protein LOC123293315 isoform X2 n=1 Tax=Chrysoperla carnea TaxID=189513 RepID=UPI001D06F276|nr:uncharacterized protein LOC123293315 isoform X2 [Chrysoperla carnea]
MIVLFQMILCTGKQLFQFIFSKIYSTYFPFNDDTQNRVRCIYEGEPACYDSERGLQFSPPLYSQRYLAVQDLIRDERWNGKIHKIVDFGCAELKFFKYTKNMRGVHEVLEVDIQSSTLESNIYRVQPLIVDFIQRRSEALDVSVLAGSIADPDPRLLNTDMVVAIEIIEHLYPDTLEAIPYNIFEFIKPCVVVFTTPNVDFNVLFPPRSTFRHDDHKFEWTRRQFQDWAYNIVARFPEYAVWFDGVGALPAGTLENLGCCTQMAIFHNPDYKSRKLRENDACYYKLITEVNFPYEEVDELSHNDKILNEVMYRLTIYGVEYGLYFNYTKWRSEVPVTFLHTFVRDLCTLDELVIILKDHYIMENRLIDDTIQMCVIYEINDTSSERTTSISSDAASESQLHVINASDSDWETVQYSDPKYSNSSLILKSHACTDDNLSEKMLEEVEIQSILPKDVGINCNLSEEAVGEVLQTVVIPSTRSILSEVGTNQITSLPKDELKLVDEFDKKIDADTLIEKNKVESLLPFIEFRPPSAELRTKSEIVGNGSHQKTDKKTIKSNSKQIEINVKLQNSKSKLTSAKLNDLKFQVFPPVVDLNKPEELKPQIVNLPNVPLPLPPRIVENGDLINNNRDREGNNYEAVDDENGLENNLEDWNFDQHNENHIVRVDDIVPVIPEVRLKDRAAEDVIEYIIPGKKGPHDLIRDLVEHVPEPEPINYQSYQVNDFPIRPDKSRYSVYFRNESDMYRNNGETASGQSTSSLEVNTSNADADELSVLSDRHPSVHFDVSNGSEVSENSVYHELMPEPFPEWLVRLMPVVNLEHHETLDYLSQGDNLTVNPNDDFEESSSAASDNNVDADDEDNGSADILGIDDSNPGLAPNIMLLGQSSSQQTNIDSIDTDDYFFDSVNDLPSDEVFLLAADDSQLELENTLQRVQNVLQSNDKSSSHSKPPPSS